MYDTQTSTVTEIREITQHGLGEKDESDKNSTGFRIRWNCIL